MTEHFRHVEMSAGHPRSARYREYMARAEALIPVLQERAPRAEELRQLPPETVKDLHESNLFRMLQPERIGGGELDYNCLIDIAAILARGCASTAWNLTNLASHHWMLAMYPEAAQKRIWDENPEMLIASSFIFPIGRAKRVKGGHVLSGRWPFSSGVNSSEWNMLAGMVAPEDGEAPDPRVFLLPRSEYEIINVWDVTGLRGTGSDDVKCEEVFVPEHMSVSARDLKGGPTPGSAQNPSPLYKLPVFALFPLILSGIPLGIAEASLADYVQNSRNRSSKYSGAQLNEMQSTHIRIGGVGTRIDVARRVMSDICSEAMADAHRGEIPDLDTKMRYRRDTAFATNLCIEAVDMVAAGTGAGVLYEKNPMSRRFRDVHGAAAHIAFSMDAATSAQGRVALGIDTDHMTI